MMCLLMQRLLRGARVRMRLEGSLAAQSPSLQCTCCALKHLPTSMRGASRLSSPVPFGRALLHPWKDAAGGDWLGDACPAPWGPRGQAA